MGTKGNKMIVGVVLLFSFFISTQSHAEQIILNGITCHAKNVIFNMHIQKFIDLIEKNTNGQVKIKWLGGPEVIKTFDQPESLKRGTIDMLLYEPFGYCKSLMPAGLAKGLSECAAWDERNNGSYDLWDKVFQEKLNAKYIGCMHSNVGFQIFSKKKLTKFDDLKNFTCRVMPLYVPFLKAAGASPITIPPTEVYTGLKRGVIDGFMWPVFISDWGWQEAVKFVVSPSLFQIEAATLINLDKWNQIPSQLQTIIVDSMKEFEKIATEEFLVEVEKEWEIQKKAGLQMIEWAPEEAKKLHDIAYEETWKKVVETAPQYAPKFKELTSPCKK
jgi:TRAP-type transport system periplasmic protein